MFDYQIVFSLWFVRIARFFRIYVLIEAKHLKGCLTLVQFGGIEELESKTAIWSIRLSVRTTDFHSVKSSSTLL